MSDAYLYDLSEPMDRTGWLSFLTEGRLMVHELFDYTHTDFT